MLKHELIVVMSRFNIEHTCFKLIEKGVTPVSYSELDINDVQLADIKYTLK